MSKTRIAVIGGGHLGRIHAKLLAAHHDYDLVAVADPSADSRLAAQRLELPVTHDYKALLGKIDAAIVATPTVHHFDIAAWCLKHRIHCLVEKPMVLEAEQGQRLCDLATANRCTLQVGHVERFNPAWTGAETCLLDPFFIEAKRIGTYTGRSTDIGIVMDLMVHDLDLILRIVDSPIAEISATGVSVLGAHEDFADARILFENGCIASLQSSRLHRRPVRKMNVYCREVYAELDFALGTAELIRPSEDVLSGRRQADQLPEAERLKVKDELFDRWFSVESVPTQQVNAIVQEHLDFHLAISAGKPPMVSGEHGLRVVEVASEIVDEIMRQGNRSTTSTSIPIGTRLRKAG